MNPTAIKPVLWHGFALLFSIRLKGAFKGFAAAHPGVVPMPAGESQAYSSSLGEVERRLLGQEVLGTRRITRWPLGRITLGGLADAAPRHADVYLLSHKSGVALWEAWLPGTEQSFDATRWIALLDPDADDGPIARLWRVLGEVNREITGKATWSGLYVPLTLIRVVQQTTASFVEQHGADLVRLLLLDRSHRALKPEFVAQELARDYCVRQGGMTLLARRSGLDVHGSEDSAEAVSPAGVPPRSALPFLITLELLLIERAVLAHLYQRLSHRMPGSVEELLTLKQEVLDALEEYYGAITSATRFSDAVTADGERLLGLGDLYDAVMDRLDTVSFAITTRYQKRQTLLQFWLTVVFGATEIGWMASGIATWYYATGLWIVLTWAVGASLVSGLILVLLLRGKLE